MRSSALLSLVLVACGGSDALDDDDRPGADDTAPSDVPGGDDTAPPVPDDTVSPDPAVRRDVLGAEVAVSADDPAPEAGPRTYTLSTTATLRDGVPPGGVITVTEVAGQMLLRSGDLLVDALFAMAVQEGRQASVSQITDGAFAGGAGVPCDCFETGAKWTYVWTRDTAYAADLGLPWLDPARTRNSLRFKLSRPKAGGPLEIVQDTGTGGSWPVSTDRATWALGARQTLAHLPAGQRDAFAAEALEALATTLTVDREVVFDPSDGLYRGEQSFLDWREQSYPIWTADTVAPIAEAKALSTNVAHYAALRLAQTLGAVAEHPDTELWGDWADELRLAIRAAFLDDHTGELYALKGGPFDPAVRPMRDLLGTALAVREGVVAPGEVRTALDRYPMGPAGPPVIWPQLPSVPIYHNRGVWPFVTAYLALAAKDAGAKAAYEGAVRSMVEVSAKHLSHVENVEWLTGDAWVDDGPLSGPVVHSRRQLWSVAGFVGVVVEGAFGLRATADGLEVAPYHPQALVPGTGVRTLRGLSFGGASFDLEMEVASFADATVVTVNGVPAAGPILPADGDLVRVVVPAGSLGPGPGSPAPHRVAATDPAPTWMAPASPQAPELTEDAGEVTLTFPVLSSATFEVWRDGERLATGLTAGTYTDDDPPPDAASCYALTVTREGLTSHPSPAACAWDEGRRITELDAFAFDVDAGNAVWSTQYGRVHLQDWGKPDDTLTVAGWRPGHTGRHRLQLVYGNGAGPVNSGITAGVKGVRVIDVVDDAVVAEGWVTMPHLGTWDRWTESTSMPVDLDAARAYRIEISDGRNMSVLDHFRPYTGGNGGGPDPFNFANVHAVKLLAVDAVADNRPAAPVDLGQVDVLGFEASQRLSGDEVGVRLESWETFALDWDDDHLYLALAGVALEPADAPWMIYVQASDGPFGAAVPAWGSPYDRGVVDAPAQLPFTPTHQIAVRRLAGFGPEDGPWSGVWRHDGVDYAQVWRAAPDRDVFFSADGRTRVIRVPRAVLGPHDRIRLVAHVLLGEAGDEWKDTVPASHAPWDDGGGWFEIELTGDPAASAWREAP